MTVYILDAEAFSELARNRKGHPAGSAMNVIKLALDTHEDEVVVPAAVLAEQYRGGTHDQVVDSCLAEHSGIQVIDTDRTLARVIGNLLARAGKGSEAHVDASVVATAIMMGGGLITTSGHSDITALAEGFSHIAIDVV